MARKTEEQSRQTRENILWGALSVFSEKGFSRTTLSDIAKRIGMTRGAVYWHFKDKHELLVELKEAMFEREDELIALKVPRVETLDDLLAQFVARAELMVSDEGFRKFVHFMSMQVEWATEKQVFEQRGMDPMRRVPFRAVGDILEKARRTGEIGPDVDLDMVFDILVGMFTGMVRQYLAGLAKRPLPDAVATAMGAVINSIRGNSETTDGPSPLPAGPMQGE